MNQRTVQTFLDTSRRYLLSKGKKMDSHRNIYKPGGLLYPVMVIAGVSVTVFSLLGTAAITGHLPAAHSNTLGTADKPKPALSAAPAGKPAPAKEVTATAKGKTASRYVCDNCGTVAAVRATEAKGEGSGLGAVAGGVTGAILGNQIGNGNGRTAATLLGAAGGAYLGNEIEKSTKTVTYYTVTVRMNDGSLRTFQRSTLPEFGVGQKVRVEGSTLRPLTLS
jgi:outer membrane lipoprotein SlyB